MEKLRTLLLNRLFNFWEDSVDNKEDFKNQLKEIIFDNGIDGAETLLDFCREDFEEIPIEEQENGEHEDLNKIWKKRNSKCSSAKFSYRSKWSQKRSNVF